MAKKSDLWDASLPFRPTVPEVRIHRETEIGFFHRKAADRTLKMQLVERQINQAALTAVYPLLFDLEHDGLRRMFTLTD